jgi:hypothetical protein
MLRQRSADILFQLCGKRVNIPQACSTKHIFVKLARILDVVWDDGSESKDHLTVSVMHRFIQSDQLMRLSIPICSTGHCLALA